MIALPRENWKREIAIFLCNRSGVVGNVAQVDKLCSLVNGGGLNGYIPFELSTGWGELSTGCPQGGVRYQQGACESLLNQYPKT